MEIRFTEAFDSPREEVFRQLRDRLPEIAPYIPDVAEVVCLERSEEEGRVSIRNRWRTDREIPRIVRKLITPDMLTWIDRNVWSEEDWTCRWWFEAPYFEDAVRCSGTNRYMARAGRGCLLVSEGDLEIDLTQVPGVPRLLARRGSRRVEQAIVKLVTPNLARVGEGLRAWLDAKSGTP